MNIKIEKDKLDISLKDIKNFEDKYKLSLPKDYADFLLKNNGGIPSPNICYYTDESGEESTCCVQWFIPLKSHRSKYELETYLTNFEDTIPDSMIIIAVDPSGNYILLGLTDEVKNKVFLWDHELENEKDINANIFPIKATDFNDFINNKLLPYEIDTEFDDPLKNFVEKCTVDEFKEKINENAAFINEKNCNGLSVSILCTICKRADLLELLISKGASIEGVLRWAYCCFDIIQLLVKVGVDLNEKISNANANNNTILMLALKFNADAKIVKFLIESGADLDVVNDFDQTVADMARIFCENDEIINILKKLKHSDATFIKHLEGNYIMPTQQKQIVTRERNFFVLWFGLVVYPMYAIAISGYGKSKLDSKRLSPLKRGLAGGVAFFYFMFPILILPPLNTGFDVTFMALIFFTNMVQLSYMMIKGKYLIIDSQKKKLFYLKLFIGFSAYWAIAIPLNKLHEAMNLY